MLNYRQFYIKLVISIVYGVFISDKMDIFDIKILSKLLNNCRESDRQIGIDLGMSGGAINARISKMQKLEIIEEFFIKVEPPVLGYGVLYFVISGENIKEVLEQVSLVGEPHFVAPCIGGITVCSIIVKENLEQKIELAKKLMKDFKVLSIFGAAFVCAENLLAGSFPGIRTQGTQHTELSCTIHVQVLFLNFCNLTGTDLTWLWHLTSSSRKKKKTNCAPRKS